MRMRIPSLYPYSVMYIHVYALHCMYKHGYSNDEHISADSATYICMDSVRPNMDANMMFGTFIVISTYHSITL